jgi:hypothetical protein
MYLEGDGHGTLCADRGNRLAMVATANVLLYLDRRGDILCRPITSCSPSEWHRSCVFSKLGLRLA